ncbi:hypothetical protein [Paenibacillus sp. PK3_47]|uniref:hypothetical protein n=1 Tax=Paenibacillus sp. PK3_47 TaxID=2072642 RepID=UPI00201E2646|nr:hypothetical protein [Paenibacillus sp. PK3_47]
MKAMGELKVGDFGIFFETFAMNPLEIFNIKTTLAQYLCSSIAPKANLAVDPKTGFRSIIDVKRGPLYIRALFL